MSRILISLHRRTRRYPTGSARVFLCPRGNGRHAGGGNRAAVVVRGWAPWRGAAQMKGMDMNWRIGCRLAAGVLAGAACARADIVVSASRVPMEEENVASSVSVIGREELEAMQQLTAADALAVVPGVHVARSGGAGQTTTLFIRGSNPDHVLVLVDGVKANDPSLIGREAELHLVALEDIERIEVLRGPQSSLYGSDAMGGVVNVVTRRGDEAPGVTVDLEAGSRDTYRQGLRAGGGTEAMHYAVSAAHISSAGISAANEADGNTEADPYETTTLSAVLGLRLLEQLGLDFTARYTDAHADYDDGVGPNADTPDNFSATQRFFGRGAAKLDLFDSAWRQTLGASVAAHDREFSSSWGENWFQGRTLRADWQHNVRLGERHLVVAGLEHEEEEAETDGMVARDADLSSLFLEEQFTGDVLSFSAGIRHDRHSAFGDEVTYRLGAVARVKESDTRFKATYGTAFKAPSLYQLYAPETPWGPVGNAALEAEESRGWDAGIEQGLADGRLRLGATVFATDYDNLIEFENGYVNRDQAEVRGIELSARVRAAENVTVGLHYTYTDSEDQDGRELSRRPRDRAGADIRVRWGEDVTLSADILYVGERRDAYYDVETWTVVDETLPAYAVVNLAASYAVCERVTVYGRVENLLDKEYEELSGYGTPGISFFGGLRMTL